MASTKRSRRSARGRRLPAKDAPKEQKTGAAIRRRWLAALLVSGFTLAAAWLTWDLLTDDSGPLVIYCADGTGLAETVLRDFEQRTGTPVAAEFPKKDADSSDLTARLIGEANAPRCDVYWSAEPLDMLALQERGLLQPYRGSGHARIPAAFKAADGSWTGFAARLRVIIANTARIGTTPPNLDALLPESDRAKIAFAKPVAGSALVHYTALWQLWGGDRLKAWHREWKAGGAQECQSNRAVADLVAAGICFAGYTDSSDFFAAKDAGKSVAMHPVRLEDGRTIVAPDAVAIMRGTKRKKAARQLVDFLLSAETELALARSKARRVPLGTMSAGRLPGEVRELAEWAREGVDLTAFGAARAECQAWLQAEYSR